MKVLPVNLPNICFFLSNMLVLVAAYHCENQHKLHKFVYKLKKHCMHMCVHGI